MIAGHALHLPGIAVLAGHQALAANSPTVGPRRYRISIVTASGEARQRVAIGGTSIEHAADAMDDAGLGGVVRVNDITETEAA